MYIARTDTIFKIFIRRSSQVYHQAVAPGEEISLDYKFMPDPRLEPRDFVVALTVFYHDGKGQYYSNTFFNQTIEIVEVKKIFDYELVSMFVILAGIAAGIGERACRMGCEIQGLHGVCSWAQFNLLYSANRKLFLSWANLNIPQTLT